MEKNLTIGTVILFRPKFTWNPITWLSFLICLGTRCKYSHAAIIGNHRDSQWIFEAVKTGVERNDINKRIKNHSIAILEPNFNFNKYNISSKAIGEWAWDKETRCSEYDFLAVFAIQPIFILTGKWIGRKSPGPNRKFYCSEFVAWLFELPQWWDWSPNSFYKSEMFNVIFEGKWTEQR